MKQEVEMVKAFQRAYGHPVADNPKYLSVDRCLMRHNLLHEEVSDDPKLCLSNGLLETLMRREREREDADLLCTGCLV